MRRNASKTAAAPSPATARLVRKARQFQMIPPESPAKAGAGPKRPVVPKPARPRRELRKVLLIEDDPSVRDAIVASLEAIGAGEVIFADDGRSGLDMIYAKRPTTVLLDLMLPVADGFAVLEELRRHPAPKRAGRVVVISAMSDALSLRALLKLGADRVLTKPFTLNQFEDALTA